MVVIGAGRIGTALHARSLAAGLDCRLVSRDAGWEAVQGPPGDPIAVATGCDDLQSVIERTPRHRREDLVFLQNGMFRELLREHQLAQATRGLLWMAVRSRGAPVEPGRPAMSCGPHAPGMVRWFITVGLDAESADWARFTAMEIEKLIWNTAFGVLCELYQAPVGQVAEERRGELTSLCIELLKVGRMSTGVDIPIHVLVDRLVAYSLTIPSYKAGVKDWAWRSGWFLRAAKGHGYPMVLHEELLRATGHGAEVDAIQ